METLKMSSSIRWLLACVVVIILASCGGGEDGTTDTAGAGNNINPAGANQAVTAANSTLPANVYSANFDGVQQAASAAGSSGTSASAGVVAIDPATRRLRAVAILTGVDATEVNILQTNANGDSVIAYSLNETAPGSSVWTVQATFDDARLSALQAGELSFSVKSTGFTGREVRGRILRQLPGSGFTNGFTNAETNGIAGNPATSSANVSIDGGNGIQGFSATGGPADAGFNGSSAPGVPATGAGSPGISVPSTVTTGAIAQDPLDLGSDFGRDIPTIPPSVPNTVPLNTNGAGVLTPEGNVTNRPLSFINVMTGTQQVPATSSSATAISMAVFDPSTKTLVAAIITLGINGSVAHIHQGSPGQNGPIISTLNQTSESSGIWVAKANLTDAQVTALRSGALYFDVHSAAFENGEVRGQIVSTPGIQAGLNGANPAPGVPVAGNAGLRQ